MKKVLLTLVLISALILTCSCVEEINDESIPGLGPMEGETTPSSVNPITGIDPDSLPDTGDSGSDTSDSDVSNTPAEPTLTDIVLTEVSEASPVKISGYISNDPYSTEGDVVNKYVSGDTTVYKVCYGRTITFVVELTKLTDTVKVDVYIEHYRFYMGDEKFADITVGDYYGRVDIPPVEWEENVSAKTLIASAEAPKGTSDSIKLEVKVPFGGTYHGEEIETLELSTNITP